jgi:hypothetical protein
LTPLAANERKIGRFLIAVFLKGPRHFPAYYFFGTFKSFARPIRAAVELARSQPKE